MDDREWFSRLESEYANDPQYILHGLLLDITDDICRAIHEQGISRSELAERLGVTRQYVTKFLNTPQNTRLETIVQFATALGLTVDVSLRPKAEEEPRNAPQKPRAKGHKRERRKKVAGAVA